MKTNTTVTEVLEIDLGVCKEDFVVNEGGPVIKG